MEYFKVNYSKLQNMYQIKYYKIVILIFICLAILILISCAIKTYHKINLSGIYIDNILIIKINNELSDTLKNNHYITFNNQKVTYEILEYGEYEIINNQIYQEVSLTIDKKFIDNEVGIVELYYNKERVIEYILDLFK